MDYYIDCETTFLFTLRGHLSSTCPKLNIKFYFDFYSYIKDQDSETPEYLGQYDTSAFLAVTGESLSYDDIRETVGLAICSLLDHERLELMELVCEEMRKSFPATGTLPKNNILTLCFDVYTVKQHVYFEESGDLGMIPAADSSLALLEKYEVDRVREEERCCSVCLEKLADGGGALKMPCSHMFHGGCIEEWLRTSHYCPLCRYALGIRYPTFDVPPYVPLSIFFTFLSTCFRQFKPFAI